MHLNNSLLFEKYARHYFKNNYKVLEIGPDTIPSTFSVMVDDASIEWHTLNLESGERTSRAKNADLTILSESEYHYPIGDDSYDIVISANVLEHVKKIWRWFPELKRITKHGGHIITMAPTSWPYHEAPVDCWRVYPEGIRALYEDTGLTDILSVFESLEKETYKDQPWTPVTPWATTINQKKVRLIKYYNLFLRMIPFSKSVRAPITVSYDLLSIARK